MRQTDTPSGIGTAQKEKRCDTKIENAAATLTYSVHTVYCSTAISVDNISTPATHHQSPNGISWQRQGPTRMAYERVTWREHEYESALCMGLEEVLLQQPPLGWEVNYHRCRRLCSFFDQTPRRAIETFPRSVIVTHLMGREEEGG